MNLRADATSVVCEANLHVDVVNQYLTCWRIVRTATVESVTLAASNRRPSDTEFQYL